MTGGTTAMPTDDLWELIDQVPALIRRSDREGRCIFVNRQWLDFTGRPVESELGDGWTDCLHPEDVAEYRDRWRTQAAQRRPFEAEYRLRHADGEYRWLLERTAPLQREGVCGGYASVCIGIDHRKAVERARAVAMSMVAHEQRTPLMASRLLIELSRRQRRAGVPTDDALLDKLLLQHQRLNRLVGDLSETARQELSLPLFIAPEPLELGELMTEVIEMQRLRLAELSYSGREHRLHFQSAPGPLPLRGDRGRLAQVLHNLIDNAIKYSPDGGDIEVAVEHCALEGGSDEMGSDGPAVGEQAPSERNPDAQAYCIVIHDHGIGIDPDEIPLLTTRFYRGRNAPAERFPGTGLGLPISDAIVAAHGGSLRVDSEPGRGTRVTVCLPAG